MPDFEARWSLFQTKEKKSEMSPDFSGNIELPVGEISNFIAYLETAEHVENYKGDDIVKIRLAGWNSVSKTGKQYQSGKMSPPQEQNEQRQPVAASAPQSWNTAPLQPSTEDIPF